MHIPILLHSLIANILFSGGKAKPLKAPKKQQKDLDEDELAFREKQKAGMLCVISYKTTSKGPC